MRFLSKGGNIIDDLLGVIIGDEERNIHVANEVIDQRLLDRGSTSRTMIISKAKEMTLNSSHCMMFGMRKDYKHVTLKADLNYYLY